MMWVPSERPDRSVSRPTEAQRKVPEPELLVIVSMVFPVELDERALATRRETVDVVE